MMFNHNFWNNYFKHIYILQVSSLVEVLEDRVLPTFEGIDIEAEKIVDTEYKRLTSFPSQGDIELSDLAEMATATGISHYETMTGFRQGIMNMFAVTLYHLFEQQVMEFHRKEVLRPSEENDKRLFKIEIFLERLNNLAVNIAEFSSWEKIEELHILANAVKHGEGKSSNRLAKLRPDLFKAPDVIEFSNLKDVISSRVYKPLMGEDLYVSLDDIRFYGDTIIKFWKELSVAISE